MDNATNHHWLLPVNGLSCASCVRKLEQALSKHPEIHAAQVNLALETLDVTLEPDTTAKDLTQWIADTGYGVGIEDKHFQVQNISCASCVRTIETNLASIPGVVSVAVDLALGAVHVQSLVGVVTDFQLRQRLANINYPATDDMADSESESPKNENVSWRPALLGLALSAPMLLTMIGSFFGLAWMLPAWVQWALTTPVQFGLGFRFYKGAFFSLKHRTANMDVLVALGTSAAYFYSLYLWFSAGTNHLYFEAAAVVISLVILGKTMEERAKRQTSSAIRALLNLQPKTVEVLRDNDWQTVELAAVQMGDIARIKPGSVISVDGLVIEGQSDVDEALVTGESRLANKQSGDRVLAGSQNQDGQLRVKVNSNPNEFRIQQITRLVSATQMNKPKVQRWVDDIAAVFVPTVLVLAALTLTIQWTINDFETALVAAVSVLVIACPCALGLATPTAIIAASGVGARLGVLIRNMDDLIQMNRAKTIVFDKTGTLTMGAPAVTEQTIDDNAPENWQATIASVAELSQHPLAHALAEHLKTNNSVSVSNFKNESGKGVSAIIAGRNFWLGNREWMTALNALNKISDTAFKTDTEVWAATEDSDGHRFILARFGFSDPMRPQAKDLVNTLKARNYQLWILSGDNDNAVTQAANDLGIEHSLSSLLPEHKHLAVQQIQSKTGGVIMIGDGINDAPALSAADASIAMGNGTDIAVETAGITLMRPDLQLIDYALQLAQKTEHKVRQNLFWAFIYNVVAIPLAAFGLLTPIIAGLAMAMSSVSVVSSSLLLQRWRPEDK